jgi:hypothetical protein
MGRSSRRAGSGLDPRAGPSGPEGLEPPDGSSPEVRNVSARSAGDSTARTVVRLVAALGSAVTVALAISSLAPAPRPTSRAAPPPPPPALAATSTAPAPAALVPAPAEPPGWMDPVPRPRGDAPTEAGPAIGGAPTVAPGLRLISLHVEGPWESWRAELLDEKTGRSDRYETGAPLPNDCVLVAIGKDRADVLVGDAELVRLTIGAAPEKLHGFHLADDEPAAPRPYRRGRAGSPGSARVEPVRDEGASVERWRVIAALERTRGDDPTDVQLAIDELIAAGDPAVELLVQHAGSPLPVVREDYAFPQEGRVRRPSTVGDVVVGALEAITGQSFGDPMREGSSADDRRAIARAWSRWWSGE